MTVGIGLIGRKAQRMTRVFTEAGESIPVTVVEIDANRVTQIKSIDSDGYNAVQITTGTVKANRLSKPQGGHFKKANVQPGRLLHEHRLTAEPEAKVGDEFGVNLFTAGQKVDVTATSIGKGYQGTVKRHNFSTQRNSHGNSLSHRAPGSIGQCQTPGRVFKGKKMSGQMGNVRVTIQNLEIVKIDEDKNVLLIKGAIPGAPGGDVIIYPAKKNKGEKK